MDSSPTPEDGAPVLLLLFVAGTLAMVAAVVFIARVQSDWADAGAVAFLVAIAGAIGAVIARELRN